MRLSGRLAVLFYGLRPRELSQMRLYDKQHWTRAGHLSQKF